MNEDVTRISGFAVELSVDAMLESKNIEELKESYEDAKDALEGVFNSVKARIEYFG
jgi:hypothetical protein